MSNGLVRVGDQIQGVCKGPGRDHPKNVTGVWQTGSGVIITEGIPVVRSTVDTGIASCGHTFFGVRGSGKLQCQGYDVMVVGDPVNIQGGEGVCTTGSSISTSSI